jgi:hypothetical protein
MSAHSFFADRRTMSSTSHARADIADPTTKRATWYLVADQVTAAIAYLLSGSFPSMS